MLEDEQFFAVDLFESFEPAVVYAGYEVIE